MIRRRVATDKLEIHICNGERKRCEYFVLVNLITLSPVTSPSGLYANHSLFLSVVNLLFLLGIIMLIVQLYTSARYAKLGYPVRNIDFTLTLINWRLYIQNY